MTENIELLRNNLPTGFFLLGKEDLSTLNNPNYELINPDIFEDGANPYDDASVFLDGSCQLFALSLHRKYGYMVLNLQTKTNINAHYFCKATYMGKEVYIDVRGITANLKDIISHFTSENSPKIVPYDFANEKVLSKSDMHGLEFAEYVIDTFPHFYNISELENVL